MSTLDDIINLTENLEVKRALAVKMFFSDFKKVGWYLEIPQPV